MALLKLAIDSKPRGCDVVSVRVDDVAPSGYRHGPGDDPPEEDGQASPFRAERDGKGIQYARRLMSREGRKDGLYWPVAEGEDDSPIGPLIARAQREGYRGRAKQENGQAAYHGYYYRMLYGQGRNAADGARDYIVNDRMIGSFALIATPAEYGNSGIMTFIVNQDGVVYEKDLGPQSADEAQRIKLFDPDSSWGKISEE